MAIDTRDEYRFCTISQDLICGTEYLMPYRDDKKLLIGCDIAFIQEGAIERKRVADGKSFDKTLFEKEMDKFIRQQRLVNAQSELMELATRNVNENDLGAYLKLPFGEILTADIPLQNQTIQESHSEFRFSPQDLTQASDITRYLDSKPISSMFEDLNKLSCCERYILTGSSTDIIYPAQTRVTDIVLTSDDGETVHPAIPYGDIRTKPNMLYQSDLCVVVYHSSDPEEAVKTKSWSMVQSSRNWYDDSYPEYRLEFRPFPFSWTEEQNLTAYGDLINACVGYAQLSVTTWQISAVPDVDGKYETGFSDKDIKGFYWPFIAKRRADRNYWYIDNDSIRQAVQAIKARVGYQDFSYPVEFHNGQVVACNIDVGWWRPVYYLTDRTMTK